MTCDLEGIVRSMKKVKVFTKWCSFFHFFSKRYREGAKKREGRVGPKKRNRCALFFDVVVVVVVVVSKIAFDVKTTKRVLDERTAFLFRTKSEFPEAFA